MGVLIKKINKLKKEKNAVILVHNYQRKEIYEVADFIGDSLDLSKAATKTKANIIIFCGVDFMAQSAKILNPKKKVLIPNKNAKCPMAAMVDIKELKQLKKKHPKAAVLSYINTNAETKAASDICCTSMNFIKITNKLPNKEIIFLPDKNMGKYLKKNTNKKIILWNGYCYVHDKILVNNIKKAKLLHPKAKVIAHPECPMEVLKLADHITGTGGMIKYAKNSKSKEFIIATEEGMCNRLKREAKNKKFYRAAGVCFNMKYITLDNVYKALKNEQYEVKVQKKIADKARKCLQRMLKY